MFGVLHFETTKMRDTVVLKRLVFLRRGRTRVVLSLSFISFSKNDLTYSLLLSSRESSHKHQNKTKTEIWHLLSFL